MTDEKYSVENRLRKWLQGARRVVIAGIGNPIRMDDFLGMKITQKLAGRVSNNILLIECETIPESFTQQIIDFQPTHILLVDAAVLGLEPGSTRLLKPEQLMNNVPLSTHLLPMKVFCDQIRQETNADIALLLMEPKETEFGEGLTPPIESSVEAIADVLRELLP